MPSLGMCENAEIQWMNLMTVAMIVASGGKMLLQTLIEDL